MAEAIDIDALLPYERAWLLGISYRKELKMRKHRYRRDYTPQERDTLINNLHLTDKELAAMIGRSEISVKRYRARQRILKGNEHTRFKSKQAA